MSSRPVLLRTCLCIYTHIVSRHLCFLFSISLSCNATSIEIILVLRCCKYILSYVNYGTLEDEAFLKGFCHLFLMCLVICGVVIAHVGRNIILSFSRQR